MNSDDARLDPFEHIEQAILQIGWLGQRQFSQLLSDKQFELTIPQFHTLLYLGNCSTECKMSDLARATHQSAASLTGIVDRLMDKQLVERIRPPDDRRQVMVTATSAGNALLAKIIETRRKDMRRALEHIAYDDIATLLQLLELVLSGMQRAVAEQDSYE